MRRTAAQQPDVIRKTRRAAIAVGEKFSSIWLHGKFGTSFRARVSELNADQNCRVRICNTTTIVRDKSGEPCKVSVYWAEPRTSSPVTNTSATTITSTTATDGSDWFQGPRPKAEAIDDDLPLFRVPPR